MLLGLQQIAAARVPAACHRNPSMREQHARTAAEDAVVSDLADLVSDLLDLAVPLRSSMMADQMIPGKEGPYGSGKWL